MPDFLNSRVAQLRQYGPSLTIKAWAVRLLKMCLFECVIAKIGYNEHSQRYKYNSDYHMKVVDWAGFSSGLGDTALKSESNFARGDICVATFSHADNNGDDQIVGYNFYSHAKTRVADDITFVFPPEFLYSYGSYTAPEHRGRGLSPARWTFFREWCEQQDMSFDPIFYIELDNLASLKSGSGTAGSHTIGYAAYWRFRESGPRRFFASKRCRTLGVGFAAE